MTHLLFYTAYMVIYLDIIFLNHYVIDRMIAVWLRAFFPYTGKRIWWEVGIFLMAWIQVPEELIHIQGGWKWYGICLEMAGIAAWIFWIYGVRTWQKALRMLLVWWSGILLTGGLFFALQQQEKGRLLLQLCRQHILIFYVVMLLLGMLSECLLGILQKQSQLTRMQVRVILYGNGKEACLSGYMDTGNLLRDPHTGKPVVAAYYSSVLRCLTDCQIAKVRVCMQDADPGTLPQGLCLISCSTVGGCDQKMPIWISDRMVCKTNSGIKVYEKQPVMLCERQFMSGEYDVLLNGHMMEI